MEGWGAHLNAVATGGRWLVTEKDDHINVLELKAILIGLQSLVHKQFSHVRIMTDNTTAMAYIRKMGGTKSSRCNDLAKMIWEWAEERHNWLSVAHIPGYLNTLADSKSRNFNDHLEWSLNENIFEFLCQMWGKPQVDLFASRNNNKLPTYVSWKPEPNSWKVDAFTFSWHNLFYYVFPPFSLVGRVARKLKMDRAKAILMAPAWQTQPWFAATSHWARATYRFQRKQDNISHQGPLCRKGDVSSTPLVAFLF